MVRAAEDYVVLYFGPALFKIGRLLLIATICVHFFACLFFRVKEDSAASHAEVSAFYSSRGVDEQVSPARCSSFRTRIMGALLVRIAHISQIALGPFPALDLLFRLT